MTRGARGPRDTSHSTLLSLQENQRLEELLGRRCTSMATAVVQLFMALPHSPSVWSLQLTGVVSFVKDNPQRSYFLRVFDLKTGCQFWEQELYMHFVYNAALAYFHTFNADDCQVGLNFASTQEAEIFQQVVEAKISQKNTRQERSAHPPANNKGFPAPAAVEVTNPDAQSSWFRSAPPPAATPAAFPSFSSAAGKKGKEKKGKKGKTPKLSKADIGAPSGFTHVSHVGWDPNNMDPDLLKLLSCAGISEAEMKDEETSKLIYNIIEQSGGMDAVKKEVNKGGAPPPPPPGRQGPLPPPPAGASSSSRSLPRRPGPLPALPGHGPQRGGAPPPPPAHGGPPPAHGGPPPPHGGPPPPPPPTSRGGHSAGSSPQSRASQGPPPPPPPSFPKSPGGSFQPSFPPPPMPSSLCHAASSSSSPPPPPPPPPGPPRPPHLGTGPPPPHPPPPRPHGSGGFSSPPLPPPPPFGGGPPAGPSGGGGDEGGDEDGPECRGALLNQIRLGKKLKNVTESPEAGPPAGGENEGIVGALMMVMQKRSKAIHSSDEDDADCVEDDDDDDEWDD